MPSWNDRPYFTSDGDDRPDERDIALSGRYTDADLDAIETPTPYTAAEWNTTEGAHKPGPERQGCGCLVNDPLCAVWNVNGRCVGPSDHLTHAERVQEAGYELGDPKGWSVP